MLTKVMLSVHHKGLEHKVEKVKYIEIESHETKEKNITELPVHELWEEEKYEGRERKGGGGWA